MKTEHREHPLGTPGLSARRKAQSLAPSGALARLVAGLFPGARRPRSSWERGAEGEEAVAKALAKLPRDRWIAQHDRPLGDRGRNVDHLVIGRGGVFSINTKNLGGKVSVKRNAFLVNGFAERFLHVARDEAQRVSERLTAAMGSQVDVTPVIAVLAPALEVVEQPVDVCVVDGRDIARWLDSRAHVVDAATAARIYECSRRNEVWSGARAAEGVTTKVWKRYGQDRVYVNDTTGTKLGYLDRKTGDIHVEDETRRDVVHAALARFIDSA